MSSPFTANYPGTCAACFEDFPAGTLVHYTEAGGYLAHVECPVVVETAPREVCSSCFMERSVSGACGCEQ